MVLAALQGCGRAPGKYQRNFIRYVVGRWGSRRALGLYELVSEVGGTSIIGQEDTWRNDVKTFLSKISPYKQPISSSWPSVTENHDIAAGDVISTHGYCTVGDGTTSAPMNDDKIDFGRLVKDNDAYRKSVLTEHSTYYSRNGVLSKPVFCGEVGACQRRPGTNGGGVADRDLPYPLTAAGANAQENPDLPDPEWRYRKAVSSFHYTVWASLLSKASAAPLAWADGKEFGEMKARAGNVAGGKHRFDDEHYEINYYTEIKHCAQMVGTLGLETRLPSMTPKYRQAGGGLQVFIINDAANAFVWVVLENHDTLVNTVNLGNFDLNWGEVDNVKWFNPWTAEKIDEDDGDPNINNLPTKISDVKHKRPLAGSAAQDGTGPHEREDVLIWITK